jgi:UPF0716 family protein affecting phage T7 exclusion
MPQQYYRVTGPRPGLLTRIAWSIAAVIVLVSAAFLGVFVFLAALGLLAIGTLVAAVRIAWLKRRMNAAQASNGRPDGTRTIEGEYSVVSEDDAREQDGPPR